MQYDSLNYNGSNTLSFTPNNDGQRYWNIPDLASQSNALISIFDRYGKLLKVLLQLPLAGTEDNGADLPSDDYWFIVNYDLGKDKIFKSHFS
jgi:gliding motility-associated-like protein